MNLRKLLKLTKTKLDYKIILNNEIVHKSSDGRPYEYYFNEVIDIYLNNDCIDITISENEISKEIIYYNDLINVINNNSRISIILDKYKKNGIVRVIEFDFYEISIT